MPTGGKPIYYDPQSTQDQLQSYARKKNFFHNDDNKKLEDYQFVKSHSLQNPVCVDLLTLFLYKHKTNNAYALFHGGQYCALVHASSEMLCSMVYGQPMSTISNVVTKSVHLAENKSIDTNEEEIHEVFYYLITQTRLSNRRKECLLLAYKVCDILSKSN